MECKFSEEFFQKMIDQVKKQAEEEEGLDKTQHDVVGQ